MVFLDDDVLAYIPHDERHAKILARERRVLARIAPRLSFAVPKPVGPLDAKLDLREAVRGRAGGASSPASNAWLMHALEELHASLSVGELDAFGLEPPYFQGAEAFNGTIAARDPREDVLLHTDFASHNFTHDEAGLPIGVFDFHDIRRGPRWVDLRHLGDERAASTLRAPLR